MQPELEYAMTHVSVGGLRTACLRPESVRSIVGRVVAWRDAPEGCHNCGAPASVLRHGLSFCLACREVDTMRSAAPMAVSQRQDVEPPQGDGFEGHAIVTDVLSLDLGGFREKIAPEALDRTFTEGVDVRALWNHDTAQPLGRLSAGTFAMRRDSIGLAVQILAPAWASSQRESVGRRDVTGMSFGFRALEDEWFLDGPIPIRTVTDMRVSEVSVVSFPAYPQTDIRLAEGMTLMRGNRASWLQRWHRTRVAMV